MGALQTTTELLRLFSEPARVRLMAVLAHEELTVAELTGVTQLGQSRVSTHLGRLRDAGLVSDRRVGNAAFYSLNAAGMPADAERLWQAMRETMQDTVLEQDLVRARAVVHARKRGMTWADAVAGQMERHYSPGRTWQTTARALLGLCRLGDVLDVASGDGAVAELVAPRAKSITCLDVSEPVIRAARKRLAHLDNVRFEIGEMHALPFDDNSFDVVMLMHCMTYSNKPGRVLEGVARVLRPGGLVTGATLKKHTHYDTVARYGHVRHGCRPRSLAAKLEHAGLDVEFCDVTSRESNPPHFEVITFYASKT